MTGRIDAHHHLWRLARGDYGWLTPKLAPIYRDFTMADLEPLLDRHQIEGTILVQAAPTEAETTFLLEQAMTASRVCGVIGWIDFDAPDAARRVTEISENDLLVGLRPMIQDIADDDWILRPALEPVFTRMTEVGLVFDALALPRHLERVAQIAERHPTLTIILDHLGKPGIASGDLDPWRDLIKTLASYPNVHCKLSGMATEAEPDWTIDDLRPFADHVLDRFGPARVLWGSDWPVVDLAGGYDRWWAASEALLKDLSTSERQAVLGGNATILYLKNRGKPAC
jgi:L-fuconolactonase